MGMAIEAKQTEAKRLAQILESSQDFYPESSMRFNTNLADSCDQAAAELRRLDTENNELREVLHAFLRAPSVGSTVQSMKVKAVQEPGYANVWSVQTETGATIARMTVDANAEAWARRIESALNAKSTGELYKTAANAQDLADEYNRLIRYMDAGGDFFAFQVAESRRRNGVQTEPN